MSTFSEPQGEVRGQSVAPWNEMRGAPDYSQQGDPSQAQSTTFDPLKQPQYDLQGDLNAPSDPVFEDPGRAGRSYNRETSGATGARSGSVSRERAAQQGQRGRGDAIDYGADNSRRVTSPSRAMGARSGSIGASPNRGRRETTDGGPTGFRSTSSSRQVSEATDS